MSKAKAPARYDLPYDWRGMRREGESRQYARQRARLANKAIHSQAKTEASRRKGKKVLAAADKK